MPSDDPTRDPAERSAAERFAEAEAGHGDWLDAATAYAATDDGHTQLVADLLPLAELTGDDDCPRDQWPRS